MFYASKWHQFSFRCNKRLFFLSIQQPHHSIVWKWIPNLPSPVWSVFLRRAVQWNQRWRTVMSGFQMQKKGLLGARRDKNSFRYSTSALLFQPLFFILTEAHLLLASRLSGAAPEFLCTAGHLTVQLIQWKGEPDRGLHSEPAPCRRCQQKTNKNRHRHGAALQLDNNILFSISCLSFPSIKLFSKAFHNHKTFQFPFFLCTFVSYIHKNYSDVWQTFTSNDVEAERKSKNITASNFPFFFFLVLLLFVFRATLVRRSDVSPCTEDVLPDPPSSNSNSASPVLTTWLGRNGPTPCAAG